ncbi:hypothetical protein [Paraburkholderia sp. J11-2]|uniref:hypothetical protein n=1 Tax=Paraburkholderia sp. J11-2 TaxID=2805431 RepID=UPI002AB6EB98|nr:hypothetical protein [Paraburkholderia sp. J11-2]
MATKEAKDLQVGDVEVRNGMSRHKITAVVPIVRLGGYVEVRSHQVGKPDNTTVATVPAHMLVKVADDKTL